MARKRVTKKPSKKPGTVNKAQAIRDEATVLGKKARPRDIIAALAAKGITVSSPQVSSTLKAAGLRKGRKPKGTLTAAVPSSNGHGISINELLLVKKVAEQVGGISKVKELAIALERLG